MKQPQPAFIVVAPKRPNLLSRLLGLWEALPVARSSAATISMTRVRQLCQAIADEGNGATDDHPIMDTHRDALKAARKLGLIDPGSYWMPLVTLTAKGEALLREQAG